ncbi:MAG TPA: hypothetical protein DEO89_07990 [Lachnospiraceae bacterium]|nr:hypothetical protein [Lachnospiraceae bacterium]
MRKQMRRVLAVFLAVVLTVTAQSALIKASEDDPVSVSFDEQTATLTVTGSGNVNSLDVSSYAAKTKKIVVGEGITILESGGFEDFRFVTEIKLPSSLTLIGWGAFENCKLLTDISLPDGLKSIGGSTFHGCTSLTEVTIPDGVTEIGNTAFEGCTSLKSIHLPSQLTKLSGSTFGGCTSLSEVTIPDGVTEIDNSAFWGCTSLKSIHLPSQLTKLGGGAFDDCTSLTEVTIPDGVWKIDYGTFKDCTSLTKVTIPDGVVAIDNLAFGGCTSLKSIHLPSQLMELGKDVFGYSTCIFCHNAYTVQYCKDNNLTYIDNVNPLDINQADIILPDDQFIYTGKEIKPAVTLSFAYGSSQTGSVRFDSAYAPTDGYRLTEGEDYTLSYRNNTECGTASVTVTGIGIYTGSKTIEYEIYKEITGCDIQQEYTKILYNGEAHRPAITVKDGDTTLVENQDYSLTYQNNVNDGTATVLVRGMGIYKGEKKLTFSIYKIPIDSCTISQEYTKILYNGEQHRPAITVKDGDTTLVENQDYSLTYQNNINEGTATVLVRGMGIYKGEKKLTFSIYKIPIDSCTISQEYTEIVYDGSEKKPAITVKDAEGNLLVENKHYTLIYENTTNPGTANVFVRGIGIYKSEKQLTYTIEPIDIESADIKLDETIFTYDGSSKKPQVVVTIAGNTLTQDVDYTLSYENNITAGTAFAVIQGIGHYKGVVKMTFTIVPYSGGGDSVYDKDNTLISNNMIYTITDDEENEVEVTSFSNKKLTNLVIPATVKSGDKEYKVTSIGQKAFYKNTKLKRITIGNNITSIEDYAFYGCKNVTSIKMGKSVEIIGASSFRKCTKLTGIVLPKSIDELGKNAFYGCKKLKTITILADSVIDVSENAIKGISQRAVIKVPKKLVKGYKKELKGKTGFKKTMKLKKK